MRFIIILVMCLYAFPAQAFRIELGDIVFTFPDNVEDYYQSRSYHNQKRREAVREHRQVHRHTVPDIEYVRTKTKLTPGNIYISSAQLKLYYALDEHEAVVYPVAVGREGAGWRGSELVTGIKHWPDWRPTPEMREKDPRLPVLVQGGPKNPLGAAAIYLGDTLYRIHGTNDPTSIGTRASSGCIRMYNDHVLDLIKRIDIGTRVIVK